MMSSHSLKKAFFALASYPEAILAKEYLKPYKTMPRKYLIARTRSTGLSRASNLERWR